MIACRERFSGHAAAENITPVIYKNSARAIVRRIERDFDFDAAFRAEELHPLVRHELRAAHERGLSTGKIEQDGGDPVRLELGVPFYKTDHPRGLLAEDESRRGDGIATDVEDAAPAPVQNIPDVRGVAIEIAEGSHDRAQLPDSTGTDQFARAQPLGMRSHHEGFANLDAKFIAGFEQAAGLRGIAADGFFAEDMLNVAGGANGPLDVHVIGQGIIDSLDLAIGEEFFVGAVGFGNGKLCGDVFRFFDGTGGDGGDFGPLALLHGGNDLARGDVRGAQNSPFDFRRHDPSLLIITK